MNFKHLRYFWTVAKAGGVMRAGEQLNTTRKRCLARSSSWKNGWATTCSANGARPELTSEGRVAALGYAEQIFALGTSWKSPSGWRGQEKPWSSGWAWPTRLPNQWPITCWSLRWACRSVCT